MGRLTLVRLLELSATSFSSNMARHVATLLKSCVTSNKSPIQLLMILKELPIQALDTLSSYKIYLKSKRPALHLGYQIPLQGYFEESPSRRGP